MATENKFNSKEMSILLNLSSWKKVIFFLFQFFKYNNKQYAVPIERSQIGFLKKRVREEKWEAAASQILVKN